RPPDGQEDHAGVGWAFGRCACTVTEHTPRPPTPPCLPRPVAGPSRNVWTERESQETAIHARATVEVTAFNENLLPRPGTQRQQGRQDQTPHRPLQAEDEPRDGRLQQRACSSQTRSVPLNTLNRSTIESG
ncbi:hypothetical protein chiPu_0027512, partial [Chiloscyllium punctatum]|nr:hypothetical protein [Chiloscyllium punctatum]